MKAHEALLIFTLIFSVSLRAAPTANLKKSYEQTKKINQAATLKEITFATDSYLLAPVMRQQILDAMDEARKKGEIKEVRILAWGDEEYPKDKRHLDNVNRRLADDRLHEVRNYIEEHSNVRPIRGINMAERPDTLEEIVNATTNAKVKNAMEKKGLTHPSDRKIPGRSARALVMVLLK